ncbi:reverse transcriptase domain-containing protein [Tanacetum coccineum]
MNNIFLEGRIELKLCEAKTVETFVCEPPRLNSRKCHPILSIAIFRGDDKLSVIIAKDLKDEENGMPLLRILKCIESFKTLKRKLTEAFRSIALRLGLAFELMCDASDFAIGAVWERKTIQAFSNLYHYVAMDMNEAQTLYTIQKKELLLRGVCFVKFRFISCPVQKHSVYCKHSAITSISFAKKDAKARPCGGSYCSKNVDYYVRDKKGVKIYADSSFKTGKSSQDKFENQEINEAFPLEPLDLSALKDG